MSYLSRRGNRPNIVSSKSSHSHIINDDVVDRYLDQCSFPKTEDEIDLPEKNLLDFKALKTSKIKNVIAFDGGYSDVVVRKEFPSSRISFFQLGALFFKIEDLENLEEKPFIAPEDMAKLKSIERQKLVVPVKNIRFEEQGTLTHSIRKTLHDFVCEGDNKLVEALKWLIFEEYNSPIDSWKLASCPHCGETHISLDRSKISSEFTFSCSECNGVLYLIDVLRLHEAIDDELGAGGILGYLSSALEQLLIVFILKNVVEITPDTVSETLLIKNGPLAFFGQTANLHKPMRKLCTWLEEKHDLTLVGLEKSGPFVEHADEISGKMENGQVLLLDNEYIYKYITPGKADPDKPYGSTSYYSHKIIFKTEYGSMYVISLPTKSSLLCLSKNDFHRFDEALTNIQKLKCDMYDRSLIPVALANKLISLSNHPSTQILHKFAISKIGK